MDPVIDRARILAGAIVCWNFELPPRWALAVLAPREVFMLVVSPPLVRRGVELKINWPGRLAVVPLMSAVFFGLCGLEVLAAALLYIGLVFTTVGTVKEGRSAGPQPS